MGQYLPKYKTFFTKNSSVSLIFNRLEDPIDKHPLIIIEINDSYYYLSFRSAQNRFGFKKSRKGELYVLPSSNNKVIKELSLVDTTNLYCMKKTDMKKLVSPDEIKMNLLNLEDQENILKSLIQNLNPKLPYCSVLAVNYDKQTKKISPDLAYCNDDIWKETKFEFEQAILVNNNISFKEKEKKLKELKLETQRIEEKSQFHTFNSYENHFDEIGYKVENDLNYLICTFEEDLENLQKPEKLNMNSQFKIKRKTNKKTGKKYEIHYHGDQKILKKIFYSSGILKTEVPYVNNKVHGFLKYYYEDGPLEHEQYYINGDRIGIAKSYYKNGNLEMEITYVNDQKHGIEKWYYENGKLKQEIPYINGQKHGISKIYYEDRKLKQEISYINDQKHGISKSYYEDGNLKSETPFVKDIRNGIGKFYSKKDNLEYEVPWVKNEVKGVVKTYSKKLVYEQTYEKNKPKGIAKKIEII